MPSSAKCRNCAGAAADLFSCLSASERTVFESAAIPHAYRPHETIFHEGTPALAVYCIRSGAIKVFRRLVGGEEVVVGIRAAGNLAGMRAVLAGVPYGNTATALQPADVCAIPKDVFIELVRGNAQLGYRLLSRLARESRLVEDELIERNHSRVRKRTARFLVHHHQESNPGVSPSSRDGIAMSRDEMAQLIGTTPESLSRTLHALADEGVLEVDRKGIRVLDLSALLKRSE